MCGRRNEARRTSGKNSRVELFAAIGRDARVEECSIRELADRYHVHRRTVRQVFGERDSAAAQDADPDGAARLARRWSSAFMNGGVLPILSRDSIRGEIDQRLNSQAPPRLS
jgi:hypothetical protein